MTYSLEDYKIGWISALPIEAALARAVLDVEHPRLPTPGDDNSYIFGQLKFNNNYAQGAHNVVIACLPIGLTGKASAATVARDMLRTFPAIKFGLVVGIAGGVWSPDKDVRLGDIVVGISDEGDSGIVQYDLGKTIQEQKLVVRKGIINKAPRVLLAAVSAIQINHLSMDKLYLSYLDNDKVKRLAPRPRTDELFNAAHIHQAGESCKGCNRNELRPRQDRPESARGHPMVHYGKIASGDQVMKDAIMAEELRKKYNILCFEMEASGLDAFPCLAIRGISDYADTHKNDDWQNYAAATAAAYAKELLSVVSPTAVVKMPTVEAKQCATNTVLPVRGKTNINNHSRTLSKPTFMVPYVQSRTYVSREGIEKKIAALLTDLSLDHNRVALYGLGGSGKTQLAISIAYRSRSDFHVFWIHAATKKRFIADYAEIGRTMGIVDLELDEDKACAPVKKWLDSDESGEWRLIVDNLDDVSPEWKAFLTKVLPHLRGTIVFTTRSKEVIGSIVDPLSWIHVDTMNTQESVDAFKKFSPQEVYRNESIEKLVDLLGHLPLAIAQSAAYIRETQVPIEEYIQRFEDNENGFDGLLGEENLLDRHNCDDDELVRKSVMTTWKVSYAEIRKINTAAIDLLHVMSLLEYQKIPRSLLRGESLALINIKENAAFDKAIKALLSFSLVSTSHHNGTIMYHLHRLVSLWTRHFDILTLPVAETALRSVVRDFPRDSQGHTKPPPAARDLLPHATTVLESTKAAFQLEDLQMMLRFDIAAYLLYFAGRYQESRAHTTQYLDCYLRENRDPERVIHALCLLGSIDRVDTKYKDALVWLERALSLRRDRLPGTGWASFQEINLRIGTVLHDMGKAEQALPHFLEVINQTTDHKTKRRALECAGLSLSWLNRPQEALSYLQDAEKLSCQLFGLDHHLTLSVVNSKAGVYMALGRFEEAATLYQKASEGYMTIYNEDHPFTLRTKSDLANTYIKIGQRDLAIGLFREVLERQKSTLGPHHENTLRTMHNLGNSLTVMGEHYAALDTFKDVIDGRLEASRVHGTPLTGLYYCAVESVGDLYRLLEDYDTALVHYDEVCEGLKTPDAGFETTVNLRVWSKKGDIYRSRGRLDHVVQCYSRVYVLTREAYGELHQLTQDAKEKFDQCFE